MDNEKFNTYCSLIFVELSFTSGKFVKELATKYKDISILAEKLHNSPTDENKEHLQNLFAHNEDNFQKYVHDYLLANETEFNWTTFLNKYEVVPVESFV